MLRRFTPVALGALLVLVACTDLIGPHGGDSVRLVVQPSFGQVPPTALADNPASRVDNVHLLLRNAAGSVVLDTIVEWPLDQDTLRMELDVVVQETETYDLTIEGRSGDQILFQAGPLTVELSEDDEGSTVETSPVLEYAGPGAEVVSVTITGAPDSFLAGSTVGLGATGANDDGSEPDDLIIVWTSLDPDAATVGGDGTVQVHHDASRAVSIEARVAFTTITDTIGGPILPAALSVSPEESTLTALGAELSLTAALLGEDGGDVTGLAIEWSAEDPSVLEVVGEGDEGREAVATALRNGATGVIAIAGELADTADVAVEQAVARLEADLDSVTLEQVDATVQATATAFDANDNEVDDAGVAWSSDGADVATVSEDGTITAVSPGATWIIATSDEAADSVRVTVLNIAPEVTIDAPSDGSTFDEGDIITFEGTAEDVEDGDLSAGLEWASDSAGELGTGASVEAELEPGDHTITATVVDAQADTASASIVVTVNPNTAPAVSITAPSEAITVHHGTDVTLEGTADDAQDGDLSGSIEWTSDLDGELGTGASLVVGDLSIGSHTITAGVTDSRGLTASATRDVEVTRNEPVVEITAPADGATYDEGENTTFEGVAEDVEDGDLTDAIQWSSDIDGELGSGASVTAGLSVGTHAITATVTDGHGDTGTSAVSIDVVVSVSGTVFYSTEGLPDVTVELVQGEAGSGEPLMTTTTDADGAYAFRDVPDGVYWLKANGPTDAFIGWIARQVPVEGTSVTEHLDLPKNLLLQSPADGAGTPSQHPVLEWAANAEAVSYTVQINVTDGFELVEQTTGITTSQYTVQTELAVGETYTWQVDAYDDAGHYVGSSERAFTFTAGAYPVSGTVFYGTAGVPDLTMDLESRDEMGPPPQATTTAADGSYLFPAVTDGEYLLTVLQTEEFSGIPRAAVITIAGGAVAQDFWLQKELLLDAPADGAEVTGQPTLEWQAFEDAAAYRIRVTLHDDPQAVAVDTSVTGTSHTIQAELTTGQVYEWRVDADDAAGNWIGATVATRTFMAGGEPAPELGPLAAGGMHSLAITSDFTVGAWGDGSAGQTAPPQGTWPVAAVAAGGSHSLALLEDGTVIGWGDGSLGQTTVPADLPEVIAIAAGDAHSLALLSDGTVRAWGSDQYYQTNVPQDLSDVVAIAAGDTHSLALKSDGTVVGWDAVTIPELQGVVAIGAGAFYSVALIDDGSVEVWGDGPQPPPELGDVIAIAAGDAHVLALRSDGTVVGWGNDTDGQATPPDGLSDVVAIAAGGAHSLALLSDGSIVGWGLDTDGQATDQPGPFITP